MHGTTNIMLQDV